MALRKLLILRRPPLRDAACGGAPGQGGRLEGRGTLIRAPVDFLTAAFAGATGKRRWGTSVSFAPAASRDRGRGSLSFQPKREVLLQICCRWSHRQQSVQFMIAGSATPTDRSDDADPARHPSRSASGG